VERNFGNGTENENENQKEMELLLLQGFVCVDCRLYIVDFEMMMTSHGGVDSDSDFDWDVSLLRVSR
jgi:hypothetical protein